MAKKSTSMEVYPIYADALDSVKSSLNDIGIPSITLAETYSLDLDTMNEHYSYYKIENKNQSNLELLNITKSDEAYLFHFSQQIDKIKIIDVSWGWGKGTATGPSGDRMKFPIVNVVLNSIQKVYISMELHLILK